MKFLLRFLSRSGWPVWGLLLAIAALCGVLVSEIWRAIAIEGLKRDLDVRIALESVNLQNLSLDGKAMGALKLAGQLNDDIRAATQVVDKQQAELSNVASMAMSLLAQSVEADHAFVANQRGMISSDWDAAGNKVIGIDVRFRPYYLASRQGVENVHGAVSMSTGKRMMYVSAPVYAAPGDSGPTSGAVVARFNIDPLDSFLGRLDNVIGLLVTPHGIVFSSSNPEWVLRPLGAIDAKRLAALRETRQYGRTFNDDALPGSLPIFQGDRLGYEGREFLLAKRPIVWNDPGGNWEMILLTDLATGIPLRQRVGIGVLAAGLFILLGAISLRLLRSQINQRISAAELEVIAQRQTRAAQRKAELAEAAKRMQGAGNLAELTRIFFSEMHHQTAVLQGAAYIFIDETQSLELIGSYACSDPIPERIQSGEGLLGQSVIERKVRILQQDTGAMGRVHSGLGSSFPQRVLIAPLLLGEQIQGAVELAWLSNDTSDEVQQQTDDLLALFAMNIEIIWRNQRTSEALATLQASERKQAELLAFQQVLIDTIPYPVFYKGPDTRFLGFNQSYLTSFGACREALIGKRVLDLDYLPEVDRLAYQAEDESIIASTGHIRREMLIPLADGKLHKTIYFVSGFRNADGSPGGLVGTFIDTGEQEESQPELEPLAEESHA